MTWQGILSMGNGLRSMGLGCVGLVLGCLLHTIDGFSAEPESMEVKAMTFNIRNANPGDGPNYWGKRREWVAEFIGEQSPDVLGMQEVLKKQLDFLERRLTDYEWYGVGRDDGKMAGEYSPIFYKKARFTRLDQGTFWLSTEPDKIGSRSWDAAITRICTWVQLRDRETDRQIFVFNTHFDHRGEVARQESALLIRKRISESAKQLPWVLLGDFNTLPGGEVYQRLTRKQAGLVDTLDSYDAPQVKRKGPDSTWCGFKEVRPGQRIDYIFVPSKAQVLELEVVVEQRDGRFPSDHLPVVSTIRM